MNGPQKENGYTAIANGIMDVLAKTPLNGTQRRILDVIFRYTYGFNRKEHELSESFIAKATGINKRQIQRELSELLRLNIVTIAKEATWTESRKLKFNKYHQSWQVTKKTPPDELDTHTVDELDTSTGDELDTQEIQIKDNIKDIYEYYISLDLVKHRTFTEDIKKSIVSAMKNNKYTIDYCKVLLDRHKKVVETTKKSEKPVQVRGLTEFFGQKAYQAKHLICSEYEEGGKYYEKYLKGSTPERKLAPKDFKKVFLPLMDEQDG
jgi:phage replication O-like protein O